ncbi:unnamed protein product [Cuscuta campestris]|uniref:Uncharacterized protein n=1 Tax=Cuscuta campestris TaxID=132261 RepID=A0A484MTR4_9ASTE|nr:unnamed protein product [Cuscuta campestris]
MLASSESVPKVIVRYTARCNFSADEDAISFLKAAAAPIPTALAPPPAIPSSSSSSPLAFEVQSLLKLIFPGDNTMREFLEETDWREKRESTSELPWSTDGVLMIDDNFVKISETLTLLRVLKVYHQSISDMLCRDTPAAISHHASLPPKIVELSKFPTCECGKLKECDCDFLEKWTAIENRNKLMQFLMKLNDDYEGVRSNMLATEPLPTLSRAFYVIQQIETQRNVTRSMPESSAFLVNNESSRTSQYKRDDKRQRPDWYKGKKNKKFGVKMAAHTTSFERTEDSGLESPFDNIGSSQHIKLQFTHCQFFWH